jgi:phage-related protein
MKNYIILNDVHSDHIHGLLVQSLPPITKPRQRVNIEEIDGRDGDIVTALGYGAYDKEFPIGLYKDFDIDEIIKYFDSKGIVTFSNEPDKYYNYEIIEQIDFERLIKFRTATVKMHIQPFKYSNLDTKKTFEITDQSENIIIKNNGNIYSRPKLTIEGDGTVALLLNGSQIFSIELGENGSITIDTNLMEAYNEQTLLNRNVTGNYENFRFMIGKNTLTWTGEVTKIEVENYSRWI